MSSDTRLKAFLRLQLQNLNILRSFFFKTQPSKYKERSSFVPNFDIEIRNSCYHDMELNFLLRLVIEKNYKCIVEVGAFQGFRASDLRRLLPHPQIIACDLMYDRAPDGPVVSLPYKDLPNYELPKRALFFCVATLAVMTEREILDFFSLVRDKDADIAFVEPDLMGGVDETIARSPLSNFHPYGRMLIQSGFQLHEKNDTKQKTHYDLLQCLKGHAPEVWRMHYAVRAS